MLLWPGRLISMLVSSVRAPTDLTSEASVLFSALVRAQSVEKLMNRLASESATC